MLKRELEWVNMSPRARQAKSKARIETYNRLLESGGETSPRDLEIYIPPGPRLGNFVIRARDLAKAYGNNLLYDN